MGVDWWTGTPQAPPPQREFNQHLSFALEMRRAPFLFPRNVFVLFENHDHAAGRLLRTVAVPSSGHHRPVEREGRVGA